MENIHIWQIRDVTVRLLFVSEIYIGTFTILETVLLLVFLTTQTVATTMSIRSTPATAPIIASVIVLNPATATSHGLIMCGAVRVFYTTKLLKGLIKIWYEYLSMHYVAKKY